MILVDTGPLVAAGNRQDEHHAQRVHALAAARRPRLVPATVVAETGYLLERDAEAAVEAELLRLFQSGYLTLVDLSADDLARAADLSSSMPTSHSAPPTRQSSPPPNG